MTTSTPSALLADERTKAKNMVDIHSRAKNLDRNTEKYISKLSPEDKEDARRFILNKVA